MAIQRRKIRALEDVLLARRASFGREMIRDDAMLYLAIACVSSHRCEQAQGAVNQNTDLSCVS